jgi:hypothetical protein
VYINPKEYIGKSESKVQKNHEVTVKLLRSHQKKGEVLIPVYALIPNGKDEDGRDKYKGINPKDLIDAARKLKKTGVNYRVILGAYDYEKYQGDLREDLNMLRE